MKTVCPFCKREFRRNARALLADPFCHHCVMERIKASGAELNKMRKVESITPSGYFIFADEQSKEESVR